MATKAQCWRNVGKAWTLAAIAAVLIARPASGELKTVQTKVRRSDLGAEVSVVWNAHAHSAVGEWRLYGTDSNGTITLLDRIPVTAGTHVYEYRHTLTVVPAQVFELRYRATDGTETVIASAQCVGERLDPPLPTVPRPNQSYAEVATVWTGTEPALTRLPCLAYRPSTDGRPPPELPPPRRSKL